jgi:hypothetical protein
MKAGIWMPRTPLLYALGVTLCLTMAAGNQTPPETLSAALRAHVKEERFGLVTSIRGLPLGVRDALQKLFDSSSLDIAEPGGEFSAAGGSSAKLPIRRLVAAGCSADHCLVYYERGGTPRTWHVALFHWTPAETRFEWGGLAPAGLTAVADVRNAVLSDAVKKPAKFW